MKLDKNNTKLLAYYLFALMTKRELQNLCSLRRISKSGNKQSIIDRLVESSTIEEVIDATEEVRNNIGRYALDSELLNLRLSLGESYKSLFSREPLEMLEWYERLVIAILLRGPKKKSEIIDDVLFKGFVEKIPEGQKGKHRLADNTIRWCRQSLVKNGVLLLEKKGWIYSVSPAFCDYFEPLANIDSEKIVELYRQTSFGELSAVIRRPLIAERAFSFADLSPEKAARFSKKEPMRILPEDIAEKVRILAFSDWRVQRIRSVFDFVESVEPVDFIVYAGDDVGRFEEEGRNYFSELSALTRSKLILAIIGNDDFYSQKSVLRAEGVHDLYDQSLIYHNFAFVGLEASTSGPALFRHEEKDFEEHLKHQSRMMKDKRLVVVSHTPPHGILDRGIRFASMDEDTHRIGSTVLRNFIENDPVDVVICGHCHSHGGMTEQLGCAAIINVASHDSPGSKGIFAIVEIRKNGEVSVEWHDTLEILDKESLMHIYGIGPVRAEKLALCGISKIFQIARYDDLSEISEKSGFSERFLELTQLRAKSMLNNEVYQISPFSYNFDKAIFFDIETDIACERVWLIGLLVNGKFIQLYADNWGQEREILEKFNEILNKHHTGSLVSFSGTNFDHRVLLKAMEKHGIDTYPLTSRRHIDLCNSIRRSFIFPNQRFALKEFGQFIDYPFKHPELDGLAVALGYHRHIEDGKPLNPEFLEYNRDDVDVLPFIIGKIGRGGLNIKKVLLRDTCGSDRMPKEACDEKTIQMIRDHYESHGSLAIREDKRYNSLNTEIRFYANSLKELDAIRDAMAMLSFVEGSPYEYRNKQRCYVPYYGKEQVIRFIKTVKPERKSDISRLLP